jgi:hypothetical protein
MNSHRTESYGCKCKGKSRRWRRKPVSTSSFGTSPAKYRFSRGRNGAEVGFGFHMCVLAAEEHTFVAGASGFCL